MAQESFYRRVWAVVQKIPKGNVSTYGNVARKLGTADARRVGHALHANQDGEKTPCHRVVFADGSLAPGYVFGGPEAQRKKLLKEGVAFTKKGKVSLKKYRATL